MPELPDLTVLREAFEAALTGRPLKMWAVPQPLVVRGTTPEATALIGQALISVERRGKFLIFALARDRVIINAMLTGRLGLARPGTKALTSTAVVMTFGSRAMGAPPTAAGWTRQADWLPPHDEDIELRYRDPTRMGKVYIVPADVPRAVAGWDTQGPEADDPSLDLDTWRQGIARRPGEIKNLLKDQSFVAGIGNGYSDEVLWAARLAPFRKRSSLAAEEVDALHQATRDVMRWATDELRRRVPPRFEVEVRDFLRVHRKGGTPCPRCGTTISEISPGGFVTSWCRGCQR